MAEKKPIIKRWWFWVIVVIFGFGLIGALLDDGEDDSATSANATPPQVEETATPEPMLELSPTPDPSPEPEATINPDYAEYVDFMTGKADTLSLLLTSFGSLNLDMSENTSLLFDEDWLDDIDTSTAAIKIICEEVVNYDPAKVPEKYTEAHDEFVLGCQNYIEAMDTYMEGLSNMEPTLIEEATGISSDANEHISNATALLN